MPLEEQDEDYREIDSSVWNRMRFHPEQRAFWECNRRFAVAVAGRRSGKTDLALRKFIRRVCLFHRRPDGIFAICAPTYQQVKRIYWRRLKRLIPAFLLAGPPSEVELEIRLVSGAVIMLAGMDKPQRVEGIHLDGALIDEVDDMKPEAWSATIRPCLATEGREGWAIFVGKPRGRKTLYRLYKLGQGESPDIPSVEGEDEAEDVDLEDWRSFHWSSRSVLTPKEIRAMQRDMDPATFAQEVDASFLNMAGRTYYPYRAEVHAHHPLTYRPDLALRLAFDFNVAPGVATISQEQVQPERIDWDPIVFDERRVTPYLEGGFTAFLGEVWVATDSNSRVVARRIIREWGTRHRGMVYLYGDATGGARKSSATEGSDWDLILKEIRSVPGWAVRSKVPSSNPDERARVNALNCRLMASDGRVRALIDPSRCPHLMEDLEGVNSDEEGRIEKIPGDPLTHISDAAGYQAERDFPIYDHELVVAQMP